MGVPYMGVGGPAMKNGWKIRVSCVKDEMGSAGY